MATTCVAGCDQGPPRDAASDDRERPTFHPPRAGEGDGVATSLRVSVPLPTVTAKAHQLHAVEQTPGRCTGRTQPVHVCCRCVYAGNGHSVARALDTQSVITVILWWCFPTGFTFHPVPFSN